MPRPAKPTPISNQQAPFRELTEMQCSRAAETSRGELQTAAATTSSKFQREEEGDECRALGF
ncbi:hypothetical protein CISIN_1g039140mg [Citrus sinensis]|uniref:Uncharacterized protein n=1 Tax=Citrus sinensis TaxID=2711 RepID=A0A067DR48_CITSI|nr:hypothetical protein CISIN_1g039140mg [Citrus sinensis]